MGIRIENFRFEDCRKVVWVPVKKYSGVRNEDFRIEDCRKVVWVPVKKVFRRVSWHKLITQGKKPERDFISLKKKYLTFKENLRGSFYIIKKGILDYTKI